ncbi:MAG: hypothetical protein ACI4WX_15020, partial [Aristaeellaceae bacterium]
MEKKNLKATSVTALADIGKGELVELPGWTDDKPFVARLRRASLTGMIRAGKIPNPLIAAAQKLYEGARSASKASFEDTAKVVRTVVSEALVEPKETVLEEAGLELTEQQVDAIYMYAIRGPKALEAFRHQQEHRDADSSGD